VNIEYEREQAMDATSQDTAREQLQKLYAALFERLETTRWHDITIKQLADHAGIGLPELRNLVGSKMDLMARFAEDIDREVLESVDDDLADEPPRERLFDVLMARFDALAAYKTGLGNLVAQVRRDPLLALEFNRIALKSQSWMLVGADIDSDGVMGGLRTQGAVLAFSHVMQTWVKDEDEGLAATMAELDKTLRRGEQHLSRAERLVSLVQPKRRNHPTGVPQASHDGQNPYSEGEANST
jgi:AcrR family transcriptional regulator